MKVRTYPPAPLDRSTHAEADQVLDDRAAEFGEPPVCRALVHVTDAWRMSVNTRSSEPCMDFLWRDLDGGWECFVDTTDASAFADFGSWASFMRDDRQPSAS